MITIELTFRACPICVLAKINEYVQEVSKLRPEINVIIRPTTLEYKDSGTREHTLSCPNGGLRTKREYALRYKMSKLPLTLEQKELVQWYEEPEPPIDSDGGTNADSDGDTKVVGSGLFG